ncbi:MAG: hypothetical protein ACOCP4_04420 [Candidatus Woesearchaeota archaeon]
MTKEELIKAQPYMERIFPRHTIYPMNSMTPSVGESKDGPTISFLLLGDDDLIQDFIKDTSGRVNIETSIYTEENKKGIGKDLVIRFIFMYPTGQPICETVLYGDLAEEQKRFIEDMKKVDRFLIFVSNKNHQLVKVIELDFDYKSHLDILNKF